MHISLRETFNEFLWPSGLILGFNLAPDFVLSMRNDHHSAIYNLKFLIINLYNYFYLCVNVSKEAK